MIGGVAASANAMFSSLFCSVGSVASVFVCPKRRPVACRVR
jgi:hypothetical protein